ncbi:COLEC11 [Branchiostoma lanceolatum]|uniref:COLEC11 protein n=1 Tax=Branchiostoma lanceolatum TaxID=7740 RepID=A0A8J9VFW5_BRALA|nr:COLEC11 [Branchiostoma lanceolatum]
MCVSVVAVVALAVLQQVSGETAADRSCVCSPAIYVDYGDKRGEDTDSRVLNQLALLQGTVESLRTQQDVLIAEVSNLTAEVTLLKQAFHEKHPCPSGYVQFCDRCFSVSADKRNYTEARSACQAAGGHLAMPKDQATNAFLVNQVKTRYTRLSSAWFGLTDEVREGTFVWEDGTPLTGWSNWYTNQPDDSGSAEDCAEWEAGYGYKWNDEPCSRSQYYVCEVDGSAP